MTAELDQAVLTLLLLLALLCFLLSAIFYTRKYYRKLAAKLTMIKNDSVYTRSTVIASTNRLAQRIESNLYESYSLLEKKQALDELIKPSRPIAGLGGWAIDPDLGLVVAEEILEAKPIVVVDVGSGLSTIIAAYSLKRVGRGKVVSLESSPRYFEITKKLIQDHGLGKWAEVHLCPLVDYDIAGEQFHWYDISMLKLRQIDLLLIDGPPSQKGQLSRYPAGPLLFDLLSPRASVILDDYSRSEETEIVEQWCAGREDLFFTRLSTKKGAALIRRRPASDYKAVTVGTTPFNKIFGIGLGKTGTSSLKTALDYIGISCIHFPEYMHLIDEYDAADDIQIAHNFKLLDAKYPGSKFILTTRDLKDWKESARKHFNRATLPEDETRDTRSHRHMRRAREKYYGTVVYDEAIMVNLYKRHHKEIREYFSDREQDLLVLNIFKGDGWKELCDFLGIPEPSIDFPRENAAPSLGSDR